MSAPRVFQYRSLACNFANKFSTRTFSAFKNIFCNRRRPQLQPNPAVRESLPNIFDNLSQQLAETPLTRVLAGVKSATRFNVARSQDE
jgi:hypothetical protein